MDSDHMLMRAQIAAEWELAHRGKPTLALIPWNVGTPSEPRSYLTSCINADGDAYVRVSYWSNEWCDVGPFVRVLGWMEAPEPLK
jgi:hypothetical protein